MITTDFSRAGPFARRGTRISWLTVANASLPAAFAPPIGQERASGRKPLATAKADWFKSEAYRVFRKARASALRRRRQPSCLTRGARDWISRRAGAPKREACRRRGLRERSDRFALSPQRSRAPSFPPTRKSARPYISSRACDTLAVDPAARTAQSPRCAWGDWRRRDRAAALSGWRDSDVACRPQTSTRNSPPIPTLRVGRPATSGARASASARLRDHRVACRPPTLTRNSLPIPTLRAGPLVRPRNVTSSRSSPCRSRSRRLAWRRS